MNEQKIFECPNVSALPLSVLNSSVKHFKNLIKFDTRNPNSNEEKAIKYIEQVLKKAGIKSTIVYKEKGRLNLIARLKAENASEPALLLTSHVDTVPWDIDQWDFKPTSASEKDGYIYGRGAIDMKNQTIYGLMTILELKKKKVKLNRDIVFAAFADEEAGCELGSGFVVTEHPELLQGVEFALNEVGGFPIYVENKQFYLIQTEEKGFAWFEVEFNGKAGHGSLASKESANNALSKFIKNIFELKLKAQPSQVTKNMIDAMSKDFPFIKKLFFRLLKYPRLNNLILNILPANKREAFYAMTHDTFAPTVIESSRKINVVPGKAKVYIDCRFVPDSSPEDAMKTLKKLLPTDSTIKLIRSGGPVTDIGTSDLYELITKELKDDIPNSEVLPYTLVGFSDAHRLMHLGIKTIGFSPIWFPEEINFSDLYHGHNERIHKEGFKWGVDVFYRVVKKYCSL